MEQIRPNDVSIENRSRLLVTGIKDVGAFNESEIRLELLQGGRMVITGEKLNISGFDKATGEIRLCGKINSLKYVDKALPAGKRFFR
ncbi:MAG: YabP/YqfC family sporulation protein [Clostridia bacterium]|nr:YabP/YqfC family sporulation protein [Clostridia bacterium]